MKKPIPDQLVLRLLIIIIILLSLAAGYYKTEFELSQKKLKILETQLAK